MFIVSGSGRSSLTEWLAPCEGLGLAAEHTFTHTHQHPITHTRNIHTDALIHTHTAARIEEGEKPEGGGGESTAGGQKNEGEQGRDCEDARERETERESDCERDSGERGLGGRELSEREGKRGEKLREKEVWSRNLGEMRWREIKE